MTFPSRSKNKRTYPNTEALKPMIAHEITTQLIKPSKNTTQTHYDTFIDENKEQNNYKIKFKLSKLRIGKSPNLSPVTSVGNNILSPDTSRYQRAAYSSPVTPTTPNILTPKTQTTEIKSEEKKRVSWFNKINTGSDATISPTPSIETPRVLVTPKNKKISTNKNIVRPNSNPKQSRTKHVLQRSASRSYTFIDREKIKIDAKTGIICKNITPQLWEDSLENDTKQSPDNYNSNKNMPPAIKMNVMERSTSNHSLISYGKFIKRKGKKMFASTPGIGWRTKKVENMVNFPPTRRIQTSREHNKKFILDRIQLQKMEASLFHRRSVVSNVAEYKNNQLVDTGSGSRGSTLGSRLSFSINEEAQYEMVRQTPIDYNQYRLRMSMSTDKSRRNTTTTHRNSRKQLVYIGGINELNKYDVHDRLYDLFELWGDDKPDICEADDCIYVRFPSIAQAIDGIHVFDGVQPNGYKLSAELVLEGSQMVYIDGLDGDWNEEVFKNFINDASAYKVSIKCNKGTGDRVYAFVQFGSLEAVQSAIDRFDGETEIDGKLVRWEHMVKAYIGKIGENTTTTDIQNELSEWDPSFKYLPVEIRKSREAIYYQQMNKPMSKKEKSIINIDVKDFTARKSVETKPVKMRAAVTPSLSTIDSSRLIGMDSSGSNMLRVDVSADQVSGPILRTQWSDSLERYADDNTDDSPLLNQPTPTQRPHINVLTLKTTPTAFDDIHDMDEKKSAISMLDETKVLDDDDSPSPTHEDEDTDAVTLSEDDDNMEYEWHYYAYVWFWTKYDAMRAQIRFDKRNCFGSTLPIRFLLMNDLTQKVYVSGLMEEYSNKARIEEDIGRYISETALWRKKCIVTYRENGDRPFAYLRFPSIEATNEAIQLFDNQICFGNQYANKSNSQRIHLEFVKDTSDLESHHVSRKWNTKLYWYLTFSFLFLPVTLTLQFIWIGICNNKFVNDKYNKYNTTKELASFDLLSAMFCFNDKFRLKIRENQLIRFSLIIISYALYIIFYFLFKTMIQNISNLDIVFTALLPILLYFVLTQLMTCWCCMNFEVAFPQFHVLEHVSMYFEDSLLYSIVHIMASDFATSKGWNEIKYPWEYPIEYGHNKTKIIILAAIYPLMLRLPLVIDSIKKNHFQNVIPHPIVIEILAALLMFCFCYILFCSFNTITSRTLSYWKQVHGITELITLKKKNINSKTGSVNFLRLDNENNLFSWLSLRSFIHRKGDVVFCGLEMQSLFLIIMVFVNLVTMVIVIFGAIESRSNEKLSELLINSGFILSQTYFLCVCIYYVSYILLIGYWFGKENQYQLNRVERQKLFLSTETMKQLLNYEKYKLCDNRKINDLKLLLNSMDALVQHVETKEITPQLWGIKMNDFKWKIVITVIAAVIPSIAVRVMLNV